DQFAASAKQFEESMNKIKGAAQGAANSIARDSLPYFNEIIDNLSAGASETQGRFADLKDAAGLATQAFVVSFSKLQTFFDVLGVEIKHFASGSIIAFQGLGDAVGAILTRNWDHLKHLNHDVNAS